jgi:sugar diacid utilization regulator
MTQLLSEQLAKKEREIAAVIAINQIIIEDNPLPTMLDHVSAEFALLLNAPFCAILIRNSPNDSLHIMGSFGLSADYIATVNRQSDHYGWMTGLPSGQALRLKEPIVWEDARTAPEFADFQAAVERQGYITMIAVPLIAGERQIGTINCYYTSRYSFSEAELSLLKTLATHTATVIRNKQLLDALNRSVTELSDLNRQLEAQRELLFQSEAIHQQLTQLVLEEKGLVAVVTTTGELLGRPVALYDARLQQIAASPDYATGSLDPSLLPKKQTRTPIHLDLDGQPALLMPLTVRPRTLGYLGVMTSQPLLAEIDRRAFEHAATICTLELVKQRVTLDTDRRMRGDFVDDILLGRFTDVAELKRRATHFGYKFNGTFRVILIDIDQFGQYIEQHNLSEARVEEIKHTLASFTEQCCAQLKKATLVAPQGDRAIVFWPMRQPEMTVRIEQFVMLLTARIGALWTGLSLAVGVSTPIANPLNIARAQRECLDALAIRKHFGRKSPLMRFDELGIYALLLRSSAVSDLQNFAHQLLAPILNHDRTDELLHTLDVVLRHQFSPQKSAEALFVHPNTVKYRLKQLRELLDNDLSDTQQMLELQLAMLIYSLAPTK